MPEFFSLHPQGRAFALFGPSHWAALAAIVALNIGLSFLRGARPGLRHNVRIGLALAIWAAEAGWHAWTLAVGTWDIDYMLPLHLCSLLTWLAGLMLLLRDARLYYFVNFMGISGGIQYLLTPDFGSYGFPHFRFIQAFTSHGLLVTAAIYMTVVEGLRPTWTSLKRVLVVTNLYAVGIFFLNPYLGSNYLLLNGKPSSPSLLDLLPPWPSYIGFLELVGVASCLLLYAPFAIQDLVKRRQSAA